MIRKSIRFLALFVMLVSCTQADLEKKPDGGEVPTQYTVTFNSNGGSAVSNVVVNHGEKVAESTSPTKTNYGFVGWYKEEALTTAWNFTSDTVTSNTTLFAKWNAGAFTISYELNSGVNASTNPINYTVETADITLAEASRVGYSFAGWFVASDFSGTTVAGVVIAKGSTGDKKFWAKWTPITYNISYTLNTGNNYYGSPATYTIETATITLGTPTRTGYTFDGWYDNAGLTGTAVTTISLGSMGAKEFWAKWTIKTYTVTFNSNGGSAVTSATVSYGSTVTKPADPAKSGFEFIGWYKQSRLTTQWNLTSDTVTAATTVYAKWQSSVTVTSIKTTTSLTNTINSVGVTGVSTTLQGRTVNLSSFYMGKYEITYAQWYEVKTWATSEGGYTFQNAGREGSAGIDGAAPTTAKNEPVTMISWRDAIVWCNALSVKESFTPCYKTSSGGVIKDSRDVNAAVVDAAVLNLSTIGYRLPTEAEWEYAARYKDGTNWTPTDYLSGATANYTDKAASLAVGVFDYYSDGATPGVTKTANVGTKTSNGLGLFDMSGNVWEWCSDWYGFITGIDPVTDTTGAATGSGRVFRGGSWYNLTDYCLVCVRIKGTPDSRNGSIGFRIVTKQ
ncbi:MAG: hypothetical protein A2015_09845 [Spirochaetes bacterium GWF1_31_7]|nr:MAG: hypothetical protein A2Y30_07230 [Spirochaetes bacterium GWE1_32_154]OHD45654.1 MAG: hypothetical protein A2Y29_15750 [Spirochaetes bacterium GWE2_31_10]OHD48225.1 MAG: hypothetical protein A2015_09845 [Spirochaetes bacterium GWF1_31_7]